MNDNNKNNEIEYQFNQISLQELFQSLWKQKIVIISITLVITILVGAFSVLMLPKVYQSKINVVISMPEVFDTKYGSYTLPISTNQQYMDLITDNEVLRRTIDDMGYDASVVSVDDLREQITIATSNTAFTAEGQEQNSFNVYITANNPEKAKLLAEALYSNYFEFINVMTIRGAVNYLEKYYSNDLAIQEVLLETTENILKNEEELLANTPQIINLKDAMDEIQNRNDTLEYIVLEDIINPSYVDIEANIIDNKQIVFATENAIQTDKNYLDELNDMSKNLTTYEETNNAEDLKDNSLRVSKTNIYLVSKPIASNHKISPHNALNTIMGGIIGIIIGIFVALVRQYWFKKE